MSGFKSSPRQIFASRFRPCLRRIVNSAIMSTLTVHCGWYDETARYTTDHQASYTEVKKMKSLTFHTYGCAKFSLGCCFLLRSYDTRPSPHSSFIQALDR